MGKGFSLSMYPWAYMAKYNENNWTDKFLEKPHKTVEAEQKLSEEDLKELLRQRNSFPELPLVNYTTQYGMGCFEGLKAYPQKDGSLKIFRPDENAKRMTRSMEGLMMPAFPEDLFLKGVKEVVKKNQEIGFAPKYDPEWEKDNFVSGHAVYVRPFSYSEGAIGLGISHNPWVVVVATPVGSYFRPGNTKAKTTDKIRAFPGGTGWIKCDANYVIPTLVKKKAEAEGYMEAIFLDAYDKKYIEEGSSCNIFFYLKDGTLVTPKTGDTVLKGINRKSVLTLAQDIGIKTEERPIAIDEVMTNAKECFVTGTAAGIAYIESITHNDKTAVFSDNTIGEVTESLLKRLKGIQYGAIEDKFNWMVKV